MVETCIKWGVAARPFPGEVVSGDNFFVKTSNPGGIISIVDGLGHGRIAAKAADLAVCVLEEYYHRPLREIIEIMHEQLHSTRGVAICLVSYNERNNILSWIGIGDIRGRLVRYKASKDFPNESFSMSSGIVGYRFQNIRVESCQVQEHDLLILTSDGISHFDFGYISKEMPPESLAKDILAKYGKNTDDATVVVIRFGRCL